MSLNTIETKEKEQKFGVRELIKAFCKIVYITLYGFDHKK